MDDLATLAARIAECLSARRETLAVSESSAGGLVNAALVSLPGASAFYLGGAVIYTAQTREALLGITPADMEGLRSASPPYAALVAVRLRERTGATWTLAETGATGPTGNRYGDAPGHCCLAIAGPREAARTLETGSAERVGNMWAFAVAALEVLLNIIEQKDRK